MGSGPGIANQDGLELGPGLGPGQWASCPRRSRSAPPFSLLHFLDCLGLQANKWKSRLETYLWELGCETRCSHHPSAWHRQFWLKTSQPLLLTSLLPPLLQAQHLQPYLTSSCP